MMYSYHFDGKHCMACGRVCFRRLCAMCRAGAAIAWELVYGPGVDPE